MSLHANHLEDDLLQSYLEGEVADGVRRRVETHLESCGRCRAALDGWRALVDELDALPEIVGPSPMFRERVLVRLQEAASPDSLQLPLRSRMRDALARMFRPAAGHVGSTRIQELLDGSISRPDRERAHAHFAGCAPCRTDMESWKRLHGALDGVPRIAAPEGFALRVMERYRAEAGRAHAERAQAPTDGARLAGWASALVPSTRQGWVLAAAFVGLPALGSLMLVVAILAHPLLNPVDLLAFLGWRAADLIQGSWSWAVQRAAQNGAFGMTALWFQTVFSSPAAVIGLVTAAWLSTLLAGWILYKNVFTPSSVANRHAQASS